MRQAIFHPVFLLIAGLLITGADWDEARQAAPKKVAMREMRVGVAMTPEFQQDRKWKEKFTRRLSYASKIFESEFKIRFTPVYFRDWQPVEPDNKQTDYLIEDLAGQFPIKDVDFVIGLAQLEEVSNPTALKDFDVLGRARPFGGYLLVRYPLKSLFKIQEETVLVHELGHLFGAIHANDPKSIMAPYVGRQIPSTFDRENREIIKLTRQVDFSKGAEALESAVIQQLLGSYLKFMNEDQPYYFYYSLGVFYLKLNRPEEAAKAWKAAIAQEPEDPRVHYELGNLYARTDRPEAAIKELSKAVNGLRMPSQRMYKANALNIMGAIYFQNGNTAGAHQVWSKAAALMPDDFVVRANLALVKMRYGQFEAAADELTKLLKLDPENVKLLSNLGSVCSMKGDHEQAIRYYRKALQTKPGQSRFSTAGMFGEDHPAQLYNSMGSAYVALKRYDDALKCFAASCHGNSNLECHKKLGMLYYQMGKWDECIGELAGVLQAEKSNTDLYGMMGVAFAQKKDVPRAVAVFNEGLRHAPDKASEAALHRNLGTLYFNAQQADLAVSEFQQAVAKNWKDADCHYGLALGYFASNRLLDARQSVKNALQIDPKMKKAQELLAAVDKALNKTLG